MIPDIRRFVWGVDEPVWVGVLNDARRGRDDWRALTVEELLADAERPSFDFEGRFIAEIEGKPCGVVHANVDRLRADTKGFIRLDVVPEFRGQVEHPLVETALTELKARAMTSAQAWAEFSEQDRIELLEGLGFRRVRVFSLMEMDLADLSENIGENKQVTIRPLDRQLDDDIKLFNWLGNESFKEHFNYRPDTVEETRHGLLSSPYFKEQEVFFGVLDGRSIGYVGAGIDEKYNLEKNAKAGEIFTIGVLKDYRRKGAGARLMLHGLQTLRARGMTTAILGVDDSNPTKAIMLYQKVGFKVKKKDVIFEREL